MNALNALTQGKDAIRITIQAGATKSGGLAYSACEGARTDKAE